MAGVGWKGAGSVTARGAAGNRGGAAQRPLLSSLMPRARPPLLRRAACGSPSTHPHAARVLAIVSRQRHRIVAAPTMRPPRPLRPHVDHQSLRLSHRGRLDPTRWPPSTAGAARYDLFHTAMSHTVGSSSTYTCAAPELRRPVIAHLGELGHELDALRLAPLSGVRAGPT